MADFKGFGAKRAELSPITLTEVGDSEMSRAMRFFLSQGCSKERAVSLVAASVMFHMAEADGMQPGVDFDYVPNEGAIFSKRMGEWITEHRLPRILDQEGHIQRIN